MRAVDNLSRELRSRAVEHQILSHPELNIPGHLPVANIYSLTPTIRQLAFVCGPLLDRGSLRDFLHVQSSARKLALGVSILPNNAAMTARFDAVVARDGTDDATFDFAASEIVPPDPDKSNLAVAGLCLRGEQREYGADRPAQWERSEALLRELAARNGMSILPIDTLLLPDNDAQHISARFQQSDVVLTTRMHGALLGLALGKPVIAIDQVPGTAKVTAVLRRLGWPYIYSAETVTPEALDDAFSALAGPAGTLAVREAQARIAVLTAHAIGRAADAFIEV